MSADSVENELKDLLGRGVNKFIDPEGSFQKKIVEKAKGNYRKDIIVKFGIDPTRPDIHLGHAVIFRKLRQLQELGCKVVFLVGDFTAQIGDPTDKSKTRPEVEQKEVEANLKTYLSDIVKVLRTDKEVFSWIRNSDWFTSITDLNLPDDYKVAFEAVQSNGTKIKADIAPNSFIGKAAVFEKTRMQVTELKLKEKVVVITLKSFLWILKHITFSRLIERDMFQERIKNGHELFMHEMLYPVLQGVDSQVLAQIYGSCDLEIGGSDQLFNMLVARDVMKFNKGVSQAVLVLDILPGTKGKEKMSKSLDNYIGISELSSQMFGKVMSIPDSSIIDYFTLLSSLSLGDIKEMRSALEKEKVNPRDLKMKLAKELVATYHGEEKAKAAEEDFIRTFQKNEIPEDIKKVIISETRPLVEILLEEGLVKSKSDFKRLIEEGAISDIHNQNKITGLDFSVGEDIVLRIGKKRFIDIRKDL